ncbi:hypothetical protein [Paenalkalicoccus suaedae]|nr:hypothetical protein [Paenalkalicoccus suaedae]
MKKLLILIASAMILTGCSIETGKADPEKGIFSIDVNEENE